MLFVDTSDGGDVRVGGQDHASLLTLDMVFAKTAKRKKVKAISI